MDYTKLGKTGIKISKIGIGTWQWGTKSWGYGRTYTFKDLEGAFKEAYEQGINFIDTAEIYGNGESEKIIGKLTEGIREEIVIASKVFPHHLTYKGVINAFKRSIERLKTDYIDLYYVHWPNHLIPMKSTAKAFLKLLNENKIRAIGVSNFNLSKMKKFEMLVEGKLSANQVRYSLLHREPEKALLPYCKAKDITLVAYSPIDQGAITGKYNEKNLPKDIWRRTSVLFTSINMKRIKPLIETLKLIAERHGVKPINIALRYIIQMGAVPIVGVKKKHHVEDIILTLETNLKQSEMETIKKQLDKIKLLKIRAYPYVIKRILTG